MSKTKIVWGSVTELRNALLPEASFEVLKALFEEMITAGRGHIDGPPNSRLDHVQAAREEGNTIVQSFHENMNSAGWALSQGALRCRCLC